MIEKSNFKKEDKVSFKMTYGEGKEHLEKIKIDIIEIVDPYGTLEQDEEPFYDILVEDERCLYKHISESFEEVNDDQQENLYGILG